MLPGEWLEYTVDVSVSGTYDVRIRTAASGVTSGLQIEFDGVDKTGTIEVPNSGGWDNWRTTMKQGVLLTAGPQDMRVHATGAKPFYLNWAQWDLSDTGSAGPDPPRDTGASPAEN